MYKCKVEKKQAKLLLKINIWVHLINVFCWGICPASRTTIRNASRCPQSSTEWKIAARRKNCQSLKYHQCGNLVYQCLPTETYEAFIEVCEKPQWIIDGCAEYNTANGVIQTHRGSGPNCRNFKLPCPRRFSSDKLYEYQGCYNISSSDADLPSGILNPSGTSVNFNSSGRVFTSTPVSQTDKPHKSVEGAWIVYMMVVILIVAAAAVIYFSYREHSRNKSLTQKSQSDYEAIPGTPDDERVSPKHRPQLFRSFSDGDAKRENMLQSIKDTIKFNSASQILQKGKTLLQRSVSETHADFNSSRRSDENSNCERRSLLHPLTKKETRAVKSDYEENDLYSSIHMENEYET